MDLGGFPPRKNGGNLENKNTSTPNPSGNPMLNQVMTVASGATRAFSGVAGHVNASLKKIGAKNTEGGIGRGVGFGHGFGIGLGSKPGIVPRIQMQIMEAMTKLMMKFGGVPNISLGQGAIPQPLQRSINVMRGSSQNSAGSVITDMMRSNMTGEKAMNTDHLTTGTQSEKLNNSFFKDPIFKGEDRKNGKLQSEHEVLQMVLKHEQVIEELIKENEVLRQVLIEDLKVPSTKLQTTSSGKLGSHCSHSFDCPRKQSKK